MKKKNAHKHFFVLTLNMLFQYFLIIYNNILNIFCSIILKKSNKIQKFFYFFFCLQKFFKIDQEKNQKRKILNRFNENLTFKRWDLLLLPSFLLLRDVFVISDI